MPVEPGDPREVLAAALRRGSVDGTIEAQEAQGQARLVQANDSLPTEGLAEIAETCGIEVHDAVDDLFTRVTLPPQWTIVPTDHSMWSKLVDAEGTERASIFYKAAFYDRSAFIRAS